MALSKAGQQARASSWTVLANVTKAISVDVVFESDGFTNGPAAKAQVTVRYADAEDKGSSTCELIRTNADVLTGTAAVGNSGALTEATYNTIVSEIEAWLAASK